MMNTQQNTIKLKFGYFNRIKSTPYFSTKVYDFINNYQLPLHSYNWSMLDGGDIQNIYIFVTIKKKLNCMDIW